MMNTFNNNEKPTIDWKLNKRVAIIMMPLLLLLFAGSFIYNIISVNKRSDDWLNYRNQSDFIITGIITNKEFHSRNFATVSVKINRIEGMVVEKTDFLEIVNDSMIEIHYNFYTELAGAHFLKIDMQKDSLIAFDKLGKATLKISLAH